MSASRSLSRLALATMMIAGAGCSGGNATDVPERLVDGSLARRAVVSFDGVDDPVVRTERRVLDMHEALVTPKVAECVQDDWSNQPAYPVVHRVGISGESVTFLSRSGRSAQACDGAGRRAGAKTWCGHVFGRWTVAGRLRDPRLDLGACTARDGDAVAFVWAEPGPETRYVVVDRGGFSEAYGVGDELPVRIAVTEDVHPDASRVVIRASEHSPSGGLLRRVELEAVVSG